MIRTRSLAATAVVVVSLTYSSNAFSPSPSKPMGLYPSPSLMQVTSMPTDFGMSGSSFEDANNHQHHEDEGHHPLPHGVHAPITVINSPQELAAFLEEDDRLCVIKFHAAWCKACQRFGLKFQGLANQKVDWISDSDHSVVKEGAVRFASIEFNANPGMCRALKVKRLPSVQFYQKGEQLEAFPCGPKKFPILVEKLNQYLHPEIEVESSFEEILQRGTDLMNSSEMQHVLHHMMELDAAGRLESGSTTSTKKQTKSWWDILP